MLQDNIAKAIDLFRGLERGLTAKAREFLDAVAKTIGLDYLYGLCDSSVDSMYSYRLFPELQGVAKKGTDLKKFDQFHDAAKNGQLPNFTFIEPVWTISPQSTGSKWVPVCSTTWGTTTPALRPRRTRDWCGASTRV